MMIYDDTSCYTMIRHKKIERINIMAFEDKMDQLRNSLNSNPVTNERPAPRVSKSYTLKQDIANELAKRAKGKELTASRYLERLLKKEFNL